MTPRRPPEVSVCIASHGRPLRLRWLLNGLAEQTFSRERFEVIVATDSTGETEAVLASHPLAEAGVLRSLHLAPPQTAGAMRNAAWREAEGSLIAFTDDDCRPDAAWLERLAEVAAEFPGEIVQGATEPDPDESGLLVAAGFHRTVRVEPPDVAAQTCNIAYPREVLDRTGGFEESLPAAEDTELAARATESGTLLRAAPRAVMFHAVEPGGVLTRMRSQWRYRHLPPVVARHPDLRRSMVAGVFWKPTHPRLLVLLGALALARRKPLVGLVVSVWWAAGRVPSYGGGPRGRVRAIAELPGHAVVDATEVAACAVGSAQSRTLVL